MRKPMRKFFVFALVLPTIAVLACSEAQSPVKTTQAVGTITANPDRVKVCDGTGVGVTTLTWSASGATTVEVRIGSPDGGLFSHTGSGGGTQETGKWINDGLLVHLQDVSDGKPLTPGNTIAKIQLHVTTEGCP
jgi:hypothetical protein